MKNVLWLLMGVLIPGTSWAVGAGGFANQVVGTKAMGMANAFSAVADDSSSVFFNPAGLAGLNGTIVTIGLAPHIPSSEYNASGSTTKMDGYHPVVPNLYVTTHQGENRWGFGFGVFAPYGLKTLWPGDGPFNTVTTESELKIPEYSPAVGFKANDKLSIGLGLVYARAEATLKSSLPVDLVNVGFGGSPAGAPNGEQIIEGDGDGFGVNSGILYCPVPAHSFALTYRSDIKVDLKGSLTWKGLSNESEAALGGTEYVSDVKTSITLPPSVTLGYAFKREKLTLSADAEWVGFSSYRTTDLRFPADSAITDSSVRHDFKDKWSVSGGANYKWNEMWETRAGYSYYPTVVPEGTWDPSIPDSNIHGYHAGGTMNLQSFGIDLSYSYFRYDTITINNNVGSEYLTTVNGTYKTAAHVISANVSYKF
jgi:long-chain fatty acid transport protein